MHVLDANGLEGDGGADARIWYYGNGRCPTCRIMLYRVIGDQDTRSHSHTQPQLQHVIAGRFQIGRATLATGMTVAIPAGHRYRYRANSPWNLLVHRPDVSLIRYGPKDPLVAEGGSFVGSPPFATAGSEPKLR